MEQKKTPEISFHTEIGLKLSGRIGLLQISFHGNPLAAEPLASNSSLVRGPILEMEQVLLIAPLMLKCLNFLQMALGSREPWLFALA